MDLFGDDDEEDDAEAERIKAERVAEYNAKKAEKESKKGKLVAKSNLILDIKERRENFIVSIFKK